MGISNSSDFKEYCLQFYRKLNHPYSDEREILVDISDLETALDIFDGVLSLDCKEKSLSGLGEQFYSAFKSYLALPRKEIGLLCNSADKLSALIDPFLKKIALLLMPNKEFETDSGKLVPLWKTPKYVVILESLGIIKSRDIEKKNLNYWQKRPANLAILRYGFSARQKGVHESRIHSLEELEKIIYNVIGTYLIICFGLLKDQTIWKTFKKIIEKRKAIYLFQERVRSYPITSTLFSRKEHLFVYKHREDINPDIEGKKFLFLNYLAGRGPCFYWLEGKDIEICTAWAKKYFIESSDEIVKKSALRYLIRKHAIAVNLQALLETFPSYEEKEELAQYIKEVSMPPDRAKLLKMYADKREEVALASKVILSKAFTKIDEDLERLAISQSPDKQTLLRLIIRNIASAKDIGLYRTFVETRDKPKRTIYIYCLGEVGTAEDSKLLTSWVSSKKRNVLIRTACWYAISRIANRLQNYNAVWSLVNKKSELIKIAAVEAITREGIGPNFGFLFSKGFVRRFGLGELIYEIITKNDRQIVRSYLRNIKLDYDARDLVLALCKVGRSEDVDFLFDLFGKYKDEIHFHNHVRIATNMGKICTKRHSIDMKKFINSKEYWSYIARGERRPTKRLPIANINNQAFMRRLIAACFIEKTTRADMKMMLKLLNHNYKWIAFKAAAKLSEIGRTEDLDKLVNYLWDLDEMKLRDADPAIYGMCLLDERLHEPDKSLALTGDIPRANPVKAVSLAQRGI
jgi:hypothetical protein